MSFSGRGSYSESASTQPGAGRPQKASRFLVLNGRILTKFFCSTFPETAAAPKHQGIQQQVGLQALSEPAPASHDVCHNVILNGIHCAGAHRNLCVRSGLLGTVSCSRWAYLLSAHQLEMKQLAKCVRYGLSPRVKVQVERPTRNLREWKSLSR